MDTIYKSVISLIILILLGVFVCVYLYRKIEKNKHYKFVYILIAIIMPIFITVNNIDIIKDVTYQKTIEIKDVHIVKKSSSSNKISTMFFTKSIEVYSDEKFYEIYINISDFGDIDEYSKYNFVVYENSYIVKYYEKI